MTKFTFANKNVIVVEGYKIGDALPAKAPSLKEAAQIARKGIEKGITPDSAVSGVEARGELKDISFENGALLTVPADEEVSLYKEALEILINEIAD